MGSSYSDRDLKVTTKEEAIEIYTRFIEEWRQNQGIDTFYQLGHSLGGFLSCHYLKRYRPEGVLGLFLMSPAGMNFMPDDEAKSFFEGRSWIQKGVLKRVIHLIEVKHWEVNKIFHLLSAKKMATKYFSRPVSNCTAEEVEILSDYADEIFKQEPAGHKLLGFFLKFFRYSTTPTCEFIEDLSLKYNIMVFFGDMDWMNIVLAKKTIDSIIKNPDNEGKTKLEPLKLVKNCGHQMMFENPKGVLKRILRAHYKFSVRNGAIPENWTERNIQNTVLGNSILDSNIVNSDQLQDNIHKAPDLFGMQRKEKKESVIAAKFKQWFSRKPKPSAPENPPQNNPNQFKKDKQNKDSVNIGISESQTIKSKKQSSTTSNLPAQKKLPKKMRRKFIQQRAKSIEDLNWKLIQECINLLDFIQDFKVIDIIAKKEEDIIKIDSEKNDYLKVEDSSVKAASNEEDLFSSDDDIDEAKIKEINDNFEKEENEPQNCSGEDNFFNSLDKEIDKLANQDESDLIQEEDELIKEEDEILESSPTDQTSKTKKKFKSVDKLTKEEKAEIKLQRRIAKQENQMIKRMERIKNSEIKKKEKIEAKLQKKEVKENKKKEKLEIKENKKKERKENKEKKKYEKMSKKITEYQKEKIQELASLYVANDSSKDEQMNSCTTIVSHKSEKSVEIRRRGWSFDFIRNETQNSSRENSMPKLKRVRSERQIFARSLSQNSDQKNSKKNSDILRNNLDPYMNFLPENQYSEIFAIQINKIPKKSNTRTFMLKINAKLAKIKNLYNTKEILRNNLAKIGKKLSMRNENGLDHSLQDFESDAKVNYETEKKLQNLWNKLQNFLKEINSQEPLEFLNHQDDFSS